MRYLLNVDGYELYQYEREDALPQGFLYSVFRLEAPDGTQRTVSADKMKDALDRLFEESA